MPAIRMFLDVSTAHLAPSDKAYLDACAAPGSTSGLPAYKTTYGWFVYATDDPSAYSDTELPPHLRRLCTYARAHGCDYILFDADAEQDPSLQVFDENTGEEVATRLDQPMPEPGTATGLAQQLLKQAVAARLEFSDCIRAFAAKTADEQSFASHARKELSRDGEIEVDDVTVVSLGDDEGVYVMAWLWVSASEVWDGPTDSDGMPCLFVNHYRCAHCDTEWQDQWSCACNDRCPSCNVELEPFESTELNLDGSIKDDADPHRLGVV